MQITLVIQGNRLQEDADAAVQLGRGQAGAQHRRRVVRTGRAGDDQAGDVPQRGQAVVVVEVAAEPLLVGQPGDAHHHRVAVLGAGEEGQRGRLAADLVSGVVQVRQVLDLGHRQQAGQPGAQRNPEDGLLVQR